MNMKVLLAALAAGIVSLLLGFVVFGIALASFFDESMHQYEGLQRAEPNMASLVLFNLAGGALVAYALWKMGVRTAMAGFVPACVVGLLLAAYFNFFNDAFMVMYKNATIMVADIVLTGVFFGAMGMVAGAVLGAGQKTA